MSPMLNPLNTDIGIGSVLGSKWVKYLAKLVVFSWFPNMIHSIIIKHSFLVQIYNLRSEQHFIIKLLHIVYLIRMRELYKIFVKTWIRFVSWSWILTPKRFVLFCDWQIILHRFANPDSWVRSLKIQFVDLICKLIFKKFDLFSQIQWILTNPEESLVL